MATGPEVAVTPQEEVNCRLGVTRLALQQLRPPESGAGKRCRPHLCRKGLHDVVSACIAPAFA
jgi:hypothetical protein